MTDPLSPDGLQILVLTTVDTPGLLQLCTLLRQLPTLGADEPRVALLSEPLEAATLERWLRDNGRLKHHQVVLPARDTHS